MRLFVKYKQVIGRKYFISNFMTSNGMTFVWGKTVIMLAESKITLKKGQTQRLNRRSLNLNSFDIIRDKMNCVRMAICQNL